MVNRRIRISLLVLLLMLLLTAWIPARAPLEEDGVAADGDGKRVVRVGFFAFDGYHQMNAAGQKSGYGYDYLQHMLLYNNWEYEFIGYDRSWADMLEMLDSGQIDLLTGAQMTEDRLDRFAFSSEPIGISSTMLTVKAGNERYLYEDYDSFDGIRVGMVYGNSRNDSFRKFAKDKGFSYSEVYYDTFDHLAEALKDAEAVDAIVSSSLRTIEDEWVVAEFDAAPYYVIVRKSDTELQKEVNYAIGELNTYAPNLQTELNIKYYTPDSGGEIAFTREERAYLSALRQRGSSIAVLMNPDRRPLSYFEDGVPRGAMVSAAQLFFERIDLPATFLMPKTRAEYKKILMSGDFSVCLDAYDDYSLAEQNHLRLTEAYLDSTVSVVTRRSNPAVRGSIAAVSCSELTNNYVLPNFSDKKIVFYDSIEACINAVIDGKQDMTFQYSRVAQYYVSADPKSRLVSEVSAENPLSFCLGVSPKENALLASILNKTVLSVHRDQIDKRVSQEAFSASVPDALLTRFYKNPELYVIVIVLMFLAILAMVTLMLENRRRLEFERFIKYVCTANDAVMELDISVKNRMTTYSVVNEEVRRTTSTYDFEKDFAERVYSEDREAVRSLLAPQFAQDALYSGRDLYIEFRLTVRPNHHEWFSATVSPLLRGANQKNTVMVFIKNIDASKRLDERRRRALKDALTAAQTAGNAKGAFLSRMSHEMRTPLNAVIGYLMLIESSDGLPCEAKDFLLKARTASKHLLSIINDVLDLSSIESGRLKISSAPFSLSEQVLRMGDLFYNPCAQKNVVLELPGGPLPHDRFLGDAFRIRQIFINLLSNAVKFTPSGGKIHFTVEEMMLKDQIAYLRFTVQDTGIGMTEDFMKRVFHPFEQQDATIASRYGGSGLGMAITKNLVEMMQGRISLTSAVNQGTTIRVELPLPVDSAPPQTDESKTEPTMRFHGERVLLAEDNAMNREIALRLLCAMNLTVDAVENGAEALNTFSGAPPSHYAVILMDIRMPVMDGYEATRRIRASDHPDAKTIPIFAMSADAFQEDVAASLSCGMDGHIAKPIDLSELFKALSRAMENKDHGGNQCIRTL